MHTYTTNRQIPTVGGVSNLLLRVAMSIRRAGEALAWRPRPPGSTDADPAVRAFRVKLGNAYRPALACFLATGVSLVFPWSHNVTWFSITLSISGVGRNLVCKSFDGQIDWWAGLSVLRVILHPVRLSHIKL